MRRFDRHVRAFLARNPDGVIVHIGCGLDTPYERIGDDQVEWFDLDVPEVMELRKKLISTSAPHYHAIAASVFDTIGLSKWNVPSHARSYLLPKVCSHILKRHKSRNCFSD